MKRIRGNPVGRSPVVTGDGDKIEEVRQSVCETPQTSIRQRS